MPRGWLSPTSRIAPPPSTGGAGSATATAAQSTLIAKFPGGIDAAPIIADAETVLSGVFFNFVSVLIETIEAEIGPLAKTADETTWIGGKPSLMHMLDELSVTTGSYANQIAGVGRFWVSKAGTSFGTAATVTLTNPSGTILLNNLDPLVFMMPMQTAGISDSDMAAGPICPRGRAGESPGNITVTYAAHKAQQPPSGGGAPTSAKTFTVEGVAIYLKQR